MKNLIRQSLLVVLLTLVGSMAFAQPLNRKADTKIVDALNQLPAENVQLYNRLMGDIESTGTSGVEMLIAMLERNDDARAKVEYALDAYGAYAGSASFDAQKREALKAVLNKHVARINSTLTGDDAKDCNENPWAVTNRELLLRMLRNLNGWTADAKVAAPDVAAVQKTLAKTLKSKDRNVRMDAIQTINTYGTAEQKATSLALAETALPKLKDDAKLDVLHWMGINPDIANTTNAKALLASKNPEVVSAAAWTLTRIGKAEDMTAVASLLNGTDEQRTLAKECLKCYPGDVVNAIKVAQGENLCAEAKAVVDARTGADIPIVVLSPCEAAVDAIKRTLPGPQRLLLLRKAMDLAADAKEQNMVLGLVAKTYTLPAVFYAGQYLDNEATAQAAAQAIRVLTSGHNEINGPEVRALMKRAMETITGGDADYQRTEIQQQLDKLANEDNGYVSMFNGKDLTGWKGLLAAPYDNPHKRALLKEKELKKLQAEADALMNETWSVKNGVIEFNGKGQSLATEKKYGNFEMFVDWRLLPGDEPDAGIYLRGTPQVQIWDTARTNVGAEVGSGGLYNNEKNPSKPLCVADNPVGDWNTFHIKMVDECVTVYLNGQLVVDNVVLENYWDRSLPLLLKEQIELQAHGSVVQYRDLYIHELPQSEPYELSAQEKKEGFKLLFDGTNLSNFQGDLVNYHAEDGTIYVKPRGDGFGNLYTKEEYQDFIFRFEFKLTPGANNGIGVRAEMGKDAAYYGMEIQVLDHYDAIYQPDLRDYQYHGSVYGIIPTQNRDCLKPLGEWNEEEIYIKGTHVRVTLNGTVITEGDIKEATKNGTYDHNEHPGLFNKTGYIGFLGHGSELWFRHVRVKRL